MMDETIQQLLNKIETSWGPAVLDIGVSITFWSCVQYLITGLLFCLLGGTGFYLLYRLVRFMLNDNDALEGDGSIGMYLSGSLVLVFTSLPLSIIGLCMVLNVWNWIGVFNPKLRLAYDLYQAALQLVK